MSVHIFNLDLDDFRYDVEKITVIKDGSLYQVAIDTTGDGRFLVAEMDSGNKSRDYELAWDYALLLHRILGLEHCEADMPRIHYENKENISWIEIPVVKRGLERH